MTGFHPSRRRRRKWPILLAFLASLAGCRDRRPGPGATGTATPGARSSPSPAGPRLVDATAAAGLRFRHTSGKRDEKPYLVETIGAGLAWLDHDRDGDLDLYLVNGSDLERMARGEPGLPSTLLRNDGGRFADVTAEAGVANVRAGTWGMGVTTADYDADGHVDLYVANWGRNTLYRNRGDGSFEDVTEAAGVTDPRMSTNAAFGDIDGDGDLDLYVANYIAFDPIRSQVQPFGCQWEGMRALCGPVVYQGEFDSLYRNEGDGTFSDVSDASGIRKAGRRQSFAVVFGDYDLDGDEDIYVAVDTNLSFLHLNDGSGHFIDVGLAYGIALSETGTPQAGMGAAVGDYDNDGDEDLYITHFDLDYDALFRNERGSFTDVSHALGFVAATWTNLAWGAGFFDADNDGDLELYVANGHIYPDVGQIPGKTYAQFASFYDNEGGRFQQVDRAGSSGLEIKKSMRGAAFGDWEDDGDIDIAVSAIDDHAFLVRNDGGNARSWAKIVLEDETANRDAFGAWVRVTAAGKTQHKQMRVAYSYNSANDPRLHFGLGDAAAIDAIEVRWPDGKVEALAGPLPTRQLLRIHRGRGVVSATAPGAR